MEDGGALGRFGVFLHPLYRHLAPSHLHRQKQAELSRTVEEMLQAGGRGRVGRLRNAVSQAREQRAA